MRIALMSDLHREFHPAGGRGSTAAVAPASAPFGLHGPDLSSLRGCCDLLAVPGDLDTGTKSAEALVAASEYLDVPVIYVPGNHEFYGQRIGKAIRQLRARLAGTRVHLLDRDELVLCRGCDGRWNPSSALAAENTDAVRILGCTLWTDFALLGADKVDLAMDLARGRKNDFRRINVGPDDIGREVYRKLLPRDTRGFHLRDLRWLRDRLAEPFAGETVVVTHMAPSIMSVPPEIRADLIASTYASPLEGFIEETQPAAWLHGHTHMSSDYAIGRTPVACNPFGYWGVELNPGFQPDLVVEIRTRFPAHGDLA